MTQDELEALIAAGESEHVEFKEEFSKKESNIYNTICAFSNDLSRSNKPRFLLFGINDSGEYTHLKADERLIQTLSAIRSNANILPLPMMNIEKISTEHGDVVIVKVEPHPDAPVRCDGRVYVRIGTRVTVASAAEERRLSEARTSNARTFDVKPCLSSSLEDLSIELFKLTYLPYAIDRETLLANHRELEQQLASLRLYDLNEKCPTNAGILILGMDPNFYLPGAYIQYVKFLGAELASEIDYELRF